MDSDLVQMGKRLQLFREQLNKNQGEMADLAGTHRNTFGRYERGETPVDSSVIVRLTRLGLNPSWFITGDGPQTLDPDSVPAAIKMVKRVLDAEAQPEVFGVAEGHADYFASPSPDEFVTIPSLGIMAGASRGKIAVYEPKAPLAFRRDWFMKKKLNPAHCATIEISGPSMEPLLSDCDTALLNRADKEIRSGKTYVFRLDDEIMVKHLHWLPGGALNVISANKDFDPFPIQPQDMTPENFEVLGRVRGSSHDWD